MTATTHPVSIGDIVADKYRVERILGAGGMGVVVLATHLQLGRRVALKCMLPWALDSAEALARFHREAQAAASLRSEHVARVLDVGSLPSGAPYMVLEYLEGRDLAQVLAEDGPMPVGEAVTCILEACEVIGEAHALGITHRDIKPTNIFLTNKVNGTPLVKVLDFGISKMTGTDIRLTRTSTIMGSPAYMSPEQMRATREVDGRTDLWALGVVLYQLITGHTPFEGPTVTAVCAKVMGEPPAALARYREGIPEGLEPVILRCIEKDRELRYPSAGELAAALAPFATGRDAWGDDATEERPAALPTEPEPPRSEMHSDETALRPAEPLPPPPGRPTAAGDLEVTRILSPSEGAASAELLSQPTAIARPQAASTELPSLPTVLVRRSTSSDPLPSAPTAIMRPGAAPSLAAADATALIPVPGAGVITAVVHRNDLDENTERRSATPVSPPIPRRIDRRPVSSGGIPAVAAHSNPAPQRRDITLQTPANPFITLLRRRNVIVLLVGTLLAMATLASLVWIFSHH